MAHTGETWGHIRASYDRVARKYEAQFVDELDDKPRDRELLAAFAASVGDPVLDVGCGPGQVGAFVRRHGRFVIGLDLSLEMAKLGRGRLDSAAAADMRALPVGDGLASALLAFYALIHVPRDEAESVLREFHRILRPGGRLLISAHEGRDEVAATEFLDEPVDLRATLYGLDELVRTSEAAGFTVRVAEQRSPYPSEGPRDRLYVEVERQVDW